MAGTAAKIIVGERQQILLKEFSKSRTVGKSVSQRATIILLGFQGLFNEQIALQVGLNRLSARKEALGRAILTGGRGIPIIAVSGWRRSASDGSPPATSWRQI